MNVNERLFSKSSDALRIQIAKLAVAREEERRELPDVYAFQTNTKKIDTAQLV